MSNWLPDSSEMLSDINEVKKAVGSLSNGLPPQYGEEFGNVDLNRTDSTYDAYPFGQSRHEEINRAINLLAAAYAKDELSSEDQAFLLSVWQSAFDQDIKFSGTPNQL